MPLKIVHRYHVALDMFTYEKMLKYHTLISLAQQAL